MVALKCARAAESAGDIQNDVAVELAAAVGFTKLGSREQAALHWAAAVADSAANPQVLIAGGWAAVERGLFGCIGGNRACFDEANGLRSTLPPTLLKMVRNGAAWMHTGVDLLLSVKHQEGVLDSLVYEVAKAYMLGAEAGKAIDVLANSATPACVQCRWLAAAAASAASAAVVEAAAGEEGQRQNDGAAKSSFVEEVDTLRLSARPQDLYVGYRLDAAAPESAVDEIPTSHLSLPRGVLAGYVDRRQPVKLANHHGVAANPHAKTCAQETRKGMVGTSALNGASDSGGDDSGGAGAVNTILVGDRHPLTGWMATAAEDVAEQGGAAAAKGQKKVGKAKKLFDCTSVPWTLADLLSTAGSAIVTAEVKPAAVDVEFGPHALHTYKVKLSLADAVAAMSSTASALDMYVNIGADGPEESPSGGVGAGRAGRHGGAKHVRTQAAVSPPSPYHPPLDRFAARLAPLSKLLSHALGEDHRSLAHVNLWLGAARNGSTSGMHSDPYDNVCVRSVSLSLTISIHLCISACTRV